MTHLIRLSSRKINHISDLVMLVHNLVDMMDFTVVMVMEVMAMVTVDMVSEEVLAMVVLAMDTGVMAILVTAMLVTAPMAAMVTVDMVPMLQENLEIPIIIQLLTDMDLQLETKLRSRQKNGKEHPKSEKSK